VRSAIYIEYKHEPPRAIFTYIYLFIFYLYLYMGQALKREIRESCLYIIITTNRRHRHKSHAQCHGTLYIALLAPLVYVMGLFSFEFKSNEDGKGRSSGAFGF
jgi:hypothetical protein